MGSDSNHDWLVKTIEKTCAKPVDSKTEPGGTDKKRGKVAGTISPGQSWIEGDILNNAVTCGDYPAWADCTELVHYGQTLTLTAIETDPDWEFDRWETDAHCACDGSLAPVCVLAYADIGVYDATTSIDRASCIARFVPKGDTTSGDTGDSSGEGTSTGDATSSSSDGTSTSGDATASSSDGTSTSGDATSTGGGTSTSGDVTSTGWTSDATHDTLWIADMGGSGTWTSGGWTTGVLTTWVGDTGDVSTSWTTGEVTSWVTHPGTGGWDSSGDSGTTWSAGDLGTGSECAPCHEASEYAVAADAANSALDHALDGAAIDLLRGAP